MENGARETLLNETPLPGPLKRYDRGSEFRRIWKRFKRNRGAFVGLAILVIFFLLAIFANVFAPYDPKEQNALSALQPPSKEHLLGTDNFGRDVFSRLIYGSRASLSVGFGAVLFSMIVGVTLGLIAGYYGGMIETIIMRIVDGLLSFPALILAIALMAILGLGLQNIMIAVAVGFIGHFARVTRGDVLNIKEETYIEAARLMGVSNTRIILSHVLPNILSPIIVQAVLRVSAAILTESSLSFLGLGLPPPTPTWGFMIAEGRGFIVMAPWISTFPGLELFFVVFGLNLFGDGLRDALDPRSAIS
jgi:ABC-type dipeptide/oligopeptide/nickel transport system permease subunit